MRRTLIALAFAAVPAAALAVPRQPPAASGRPQPASSAQANAIAGQADAARMEACAQRSHGFLDDLAHGDFGAARAGFDGRMKAGLGKDELGQAWRSLAGRFGKLESRGDPQTVLYQGLPVVVTPLHFEHGNLVSQLACDHDGKVAGFHVRPLPASRPAPAATAR